MSRLFEEPSSKDSISKINIPLCLAISALCLFCLLDLKLYELNEQIQVHMDNRNNEWVHYSGKSIKSRLYEIQRNNFAIALTRADSQSRKLIETLMNNLDEEIRRYDRDKTEIQARAVKEDNSFELLRKKSKKLSLARTFSLLSWLLILTTEVFQFRRNFVVIFASFSALLLSLSFFTVGLFN